MNSPNFTTVSLLERAVWEPSEILTPDTGGLWPQPDTLRLDEIATSVLPTQGTLGPHLRPQDINVFSGRFTWRLTEQPGWSHSLSAKGNLKIGDLLIAPTGPVILIDREAEHIQFSTGFAAVRPHENVDGLWIWACLNSSPGVAVRRAIATSNAAGLQRFSPQRCPLPISGVRWATVRSQVEALEASLSEFTASEDKGQSWWRVGQVQPEDNWLRLLIGPDPSVYEVGDTLVDYVKSAQAGRRPVDTISLPRDGYLPVLEPRQLAGRSTEHYAPPELGPVAEPGDIVVISVGSRARSAVVTTRSLVGNNLILLTLADFTLGTRIVDLLNSPAGQRQRAYRGVGTAVPHLTRSALLEFRLPIAVSDTEGPSVTPTALAAQLDELLWQ